MFQSKLLITSETLTAIYGIVQEGVIDMFHTFSFLPESLEQNISEIDGVTTVNKLIGRALTIDLNGKHATIYVMGYNTTTGVGGPWEIVEDSSKPDERIKGIANRVHYLEDGRITQEVKTGKK